MRKTHLRAKRALKRGGALLCALLLLPATAAHASLSVATPSMRIIFSYEINLGSPREHMSLGPGHIWDMRVDEKAGLHVDATATTIVSKVWPALEQSYIESVSGMLQAPPFPTGGSIMGDGSGPEGAVGAIMGDVSASGSFDEAALANKVLSLSGLTDPNQTVFAAEELQAFVESAGEFAGQRFVRINGVKVYCEEELRWGQVLDALSVAQSVDGAEQAPLLEKNGIFLSPDGEVSVQSEQGHKTLTMGGTYLIERQRLALKEYLPQVGQVITLGIETANGLQNLSVNFES